MTKNRELWDRQKDEGSRAYEHFCIYRDFGPVRSFSKLVKDGRCTVKVQQLERWSHQWQWVERAEAYDDQFDLQRRARLEKERLEMMERHAKVAMLGQSLLLKGLESKIAKVQQEGETISAGDLARLMDVTVKVERLARGEATDIQKSEHSGSIEATYRSMSCTERRQEMQRIFEQEYGKTPAEAKAMVDDLMDKDDSADDSGT